MWKTGLRKSFSYVVLSGSGHFGYAEPGSIEKRFVYIVMRVAAKLDRWQWLSDWFLKNLSTETIEIGVFWALMRDSE